MERNQLIAVLVIVIVVAGAGVAFYYYSQPTRPPEDTLVWETIGNPDYLDPHVDYESYGSGISYNVYETLYTYLWGTDETGPTVPLLAASAPVWADDGLSVNITLRAGITFHDGTPLNASCVKWNFERAMKIFYPDGPVWMFAEPILGGAALEAIVFDEDLGVSSPEFAAAFDNWVENVEWITIFDETHFRFNLAEAYVPFISAITYEVGAMMSPTFAITHGTNDSEVVDMNHYGVNYGEYDGYMSDHTCGTGPYMVMEWRQNQYIRMDLYEDYWRLDETRSDLTGNLNPPTYAGSIKHVYYKTVDDVTTRILDIRAGTVDGVYLPYTNAQDLLNLDTMEARYDDIHVSFGGVSYFVEHWAFNMLTVYNFNGKNLNLTSPFSDINLRKSISYAFNDTAYLISAVQGFGVQAQGIIPDGMSGHVDDLPMYLTNMTAAVEYWNASMANADTKARFEAFQKNGGLTLYYNTGNIRRQQACLILKDSIQKLYELPGVTKLTVDSAEVAQLTINVQGLEWSTYLEQGRLRRMGMYIIGWIPDYADPDNYVFPYAYHYGTFSYRIGYNNTEINAWYEQTRVEQNATHRAELFENIELAYYNDVPMRMVLQGGELRSWRTWLHGDGVVWNPMTTAGIEAGYIFYLYKAYPTA